VESRKYHAPRRAEQAAATRTAIIDAAARLFLQLGYAATTMAAIAEQARVAVKSVYSVADKAGLLLLVVDRAIAGDDEPVALLDRPEMRAVLDPGGRDPIGAAAEQGARMLIRLYPVYRVFEQAAAADPVLSEHWREYQRRRHADAVRVVDAVRASTPLRPGLSPERAAEILWATLTWHPVALLVDERGWTEADVIGWLRAMLTAVLLPPDGR
jgi:AcrR family transcriptional regulator